ncbi:MAG: ATP-binding protein [Deferrisomatales bacterium]
MRTFPRRPALPYAAKLVAAFGAASLLTLAVALVGHRALGRAEAVLGEVLRSGVHALAEANQLQFDAAQLRVLEGDLPRLADYLAVIGGVDELRGAAGAFGAGLEQFAGARFPPGDPGGTRLLAAWSLYRADLDRVLAAAADMRLAEASRVATYASQPRYRVLAQRLAEAADRVGRQAETRHAAAAAELATQRRAFVGLSAAVVALALAAAFLLSHSLTARIRALWEAAVSLGQGGQGGAVPEEGRDEIADLAAAFNRMGREVRSREEELRRAHGEVEARVQERTAELQHREAQLRKAKEIANLGIWEWDLVERRGIWSPELAALGGLSAPADLGDGPQVTRMVHPDDRALVRRALGEAAATGRFRPYEARVVRPDGTLRDTWTLGEVIPGPGGRPARLLAVTQDVTDRKRLEAELLRSQKLEAVGLLAAGIAHDFNNLLTAILGRVSLARAEAGSGPAAAHLASAEAACLRAGGLAGRLLAFAKGDGGARQPVSLAALAREIGELVLAGHPVRLSIHAAPDTPDILADPTQIGQVLQNLFVNAREAMPSGGEVRVELGAVALGPDNPHGLAPGAYVQGEVTDQGAGIPADVLPRIFDLYYSTKARGSHKGSGLGLAICYAAVKKHGGTIAAESPPGAGATFRFLLPAARPGEVARSR